MASGIASAMGGKGTLGSTELETVHYGFAV
jgi:hypothetical protein